MNELVKNKNWLKRNWKWLTPTIGFFLIIIGMIASTDIDESISDMVKAYADPALCKKAIINTQKNEEVKHLLGTLEPIDKMAIFEGRVKYSNNNTSVDLSVRVKGDKGIGRIRIMADRLEDLWEYKKISIGIKKINKTIQIID